MNKPNEFDDSQQQVEIPVPEHAPEPATPGELPDINASDDKIATEEKDKCKSDNEPLGQPPRCDPEGNGEDVN